MRNATDIVTAVLLVAAAALTVAFGLAVLLVGNMIPAASSSGTLVLAGALLLAALAVGLPGLLGRWPAADYGTTDSDRPGPRGAGRKAA